MPEIDLQTRIIDFTAKDFETPLDVQFAVELLGAVMLYPENSNEFRDYLIGSNLHKLKIMEATPEECQQYAVQYPDFLWYIIHRGNTVEKKFLSCWSKDPKNHGHRFSKGLIVGALLELLCLRCRNLTEVYGLLERDPTLIQALTKDKEWVVFQKGDKKKYSSKTYQSIWRDYKNVAPLWWAYNEIGGEGLFLFPDIQGHPFCGERAAFALRQLLKTANLFSDILIHKKDPTADKNTKARGDDLQIKDRNKIWKLRYCGEHFQKPRPISQVWSMPIEKALNRKAVNVNRPDCYSPIVRLNPVGGIEINPEHEGCVIVRTNENNVLFRLLIK